MLKILSDGKYFVSLFVEEHNHPLTTESGRQFSRVSRDMNISLRNHVFDAAKVNIGVSKSFCFMKEMVGGILMLGLL